MVATFPTDTLQGLRDRALLLLGFAGAFRRAELVGLVRTVPGRHDMVWEEEDWIDAQETVHRGRHE